MGKSEENDLSGALAALADVFGMSLSISAEGEVTGSLERETVLIGTKLTMTVSIVESLVDKKRGIVVILVHIVGNLYTVVISDAQNGDLQLMLIDGCACGIKSSERFLPKYWLREDLYRRVREGLVGTHSKEFYYQKWKSIAVDKTWIENYLEKKRLSRIIDTKGT